MRQEDAESLRKGKESMRDKLAKNMGTKILSLVLAAIIWLVIVNIDDPYKVKTFDVPVEVINGDALVSVNKVYEIVEGSVAQVKVKGKRSVVDDLKESDLRATADLSGLSNVNAVTIQPSLLKQVSSEPELECNTVLKVSLENLEEKQVKVNLSTKGAPEDGYCVGECKAKPNMVKVSGGTSKVSEIEYIGVEIDVTGASEDVTQRLEPVAYDKDGKVIDSNSIVFGNTTIKVTAEILPTKTIPVVAKPNGKPAEGYTFLGIDCVPETIDIAGREDELESIDELVIPVDIDGLTSTSADLERNIDVTQILSNDALKVAEDSETVSVRINIEAINEMELSFTKDNILVKNKRDGLQLQFLTDSDYHVMISGIQEKLEDVTIEKLMPAIDLQGLGAGKHKVAVQFKEIDGVEIPSAVRITIRLIKQDDAPGATASPGETDSPGVTPTPVPDAGEPSALPQSGEPDDTGRQ